MQLADATTRDSPRGRRNRRQVLAQGGVSAALLASPLMVACGGGQSGGQARMSQDALKISFSTDWSSGARQKTIEDSMAIWKQKYPNASVEVRYGGTVEEKLVAEMAAGSQADVVFYNATSIAKLRDQFVDLVPLIKRDKFDMKDFTAVHPALLYQGGQYGMPFQENVFSWYVNKTLFQRAGVALPTDQWTWNDVADAARKLTKPEERQWGLELIPAMSKVIFGELLISNGGDVISKDLKHTTLDAPEAAEAGRWLADRMLKDRSVVSAAEVKDVTTGAGSGANRAFHVGRVGMMQVNIGWVGNLAEVIGYDKFEWDVMSTPKSPRTKKGINFSTDQPHAITKNSRRSAAQSDAAWALITFLSGPDVQAMIAEQRTAYPVYRKILNGDRYLRKPPASMSNAIKLIDNSRFEVTFEGSDDWYAAIWPRVDDAWVGKINIDDALRAATVAGDAKLATLGKR